MIFGGTKHHRGSHKIDVHICIYIDLFPIFSPPPFLYIRIHVHFERQKERGRYRLLLLVVWTTTISRFVTITFSINTAHFLFSMEINATLCCVVGVFCVVYLIVGIPPKKQSPKTAFVSIPLLSDRWGILYASRL